MVSVTEVGKRPAARKTTNGDKAPAARKITVATSGYFSQVKSSAEPGPFMMGVHGVGGVGKTSWAAHTRKPVFLVDDQELGIFDLMSYRQIEFEVPVLPPARDWPMVMEMLDETLNKGLSLGYETLVIDSATGMEYLCFKHHCEEAYDGDWSKKGFFNYQQGPKSAAKSLWPEFLRKLLEIKNTGINVVLIAHSQIKNFSNPSGPDFERWVPYLDKETWSTTYRMMENVIFMNHYVDVETEKGRKERGKGKAEQRFMYTTWKPTHDAKNRWGLPEELNMGASAKDAWDEFAKHVKS